MRTPRPTFLAQTQPGFESIAADEIVRRLDGAALRGTRVVGDRNGMALFDYPGRVQDLSALRTVEDLFFVAAILPDLPPTRDGLERLESVALRAKTLAEGLNLLRQARPGWGQRGRLPFRVIARQAGRAAYRRQEAQRAVAHGLLARTDHRWQWQAEGGLEFWLTLLPGEAILALRLSDERMRHRDYQTEHLPASLRPSVAAALVWLTRPAPDDVFMDPMCGAGTILIERAHAGRYRLLLGGDLREEAVEAARRNIGPRYQPIGIQRWDAARLPLGSESITAAAVNLPFGKQMSTTTENRALYPAFLREAARVLCPGARLVALTADTRTLEEALQSVPALRRQAVYPVRVLGQAALVYVLRRVHRPRMAAGPTASPQTLSFPDPVKTAGIHDQGVEWLIQLHVSRS